MRFWQAVVVAQMAAGSVWADRHDGLAVRMLAEGGSIILGLLMWKLFEALFPPSQTAATVLVISDNTSS